jgi:DNA-binding NarL/FixJ family response regulator
MDLIGSSRSGGADPTGRTNDDGKTPIQLATSSDAATHIAFALDTEVRPKGRPQSLMKKNEPVLRRLIEEGASNPKIAKRFNVSTATIFNWRRKLSI